MTEKEIIDGMNKMVDRIKLGMVVQMIPNIDKTLVRWLELLIDNGCPFNAIEKASIQIIKEVENGDGD